MELRKSKIDIIEETVAYYSEDTSRRAFDEGGSCVYLNSEGKSCAFGRLCINPKELDEVYSNSGRASKVLEEKGQEVLKEEYRGHSNRFWNDIQGLHDGNSYWNKEGKGLTLAGKGQVEELKLKYAEYI